MGIKVTEVQNIMQCKHENKKFITILDYRDYPEKLYICQDCGITITDYMHEEDLDSTDIDSNFQAMAEKDVFDRYGSEYRHLRSEIL